MKQTALAPSGNITFTHEYYTIDQPRLYLTQADILNTPMAELAAMCRHPETLMTVLNIARNQGYQLGQQQAHRYYRMMFAGQDETTIRN